MWQPEPMQPGARLGELGLERNVDEVAGDGHVIGRPRLEIAHQHVDLLGAVDLVPIAPPVDVAQQTLAREIPQARREEGSEVRVREVGQDEHG